MIKFIEDFWHIGSFVDIRIRNYLQLKHLYLEALNRVYCRTFPLEVGFYFIYANDVATVMSGCIDTIPQRFQSALCHKLLEYWKCLFRENGTCITHKMVYISCLNGLEYRCQNTLAGVANPRDSNPKIANASSL